MRRAVAAALIAASLVVAAGCEMPHRYSWSRNDYVLVIEGTQGLPVNLLLVTKPWPNSIERETISATVPFSREIKAVACAVWLDAEFKGTGGDYHMTLMKNGTSTADVSGTIKEGQKSTGLVHDL